MDETNSERIITPMPKSMVSALDDYRFANRIASRAEAIRRLIERGLEAAKGGNVSLPPSAPPLPAPNTVTIPREEYQALLTARKAASSKRVIGSDRTPLDDNEMAEFMAAPTPLAFWRQKLGYTQDSLAEAVGLNRAYVGQLEKGFRVGDVATIAKIAKLFGIRIEDLVVEDSNGD